jgi:hypothetical protein
VTSAGPAQATSRLSTWPANSASPWEEAHALPAWAAEAEDRLRQALAILQRIGAAEAADVAARTGRAARSAGSGPSLPVMQARLARTVALAVEPGRILL